MRGKVFLPSLGFRDRCGFCRSKIAKPPAFPFLKKRNKTERNAALNPRGQGKVMETEMGMEDGELFSRLLLKRRHSTGPRDRAKATPSAFSALEDGEDHF